VPRSSLLEWPLASDWFVCLGPLARNRQDCAVHAHSDPIFVGSPVSVISLTDVPDGLAHRVVLVVDTGRNQGGLCKSLQESTAGRFDLGGVPVSTYNLERPTGLEVGEGSVKDGSAEPCFDEFGASNIGLCQVCIR
jgi:hypothetical protein